MDRIRNPGTFPRNGVVAEAAGGSHNIFRTVLMHFRSLKMSHANIQMNHLFPEVLFLSDYSNFESAMD